MRRTRLDLEQRVQIVRYRTQNSVTGSGGRSSSRGRGRERRRTRGNEIPARWWWKSRKRQPETRNERTKGGADGVLWVQRTPRDHTGTTSWLCTGRVPLIAVTGGERFEIGSRPIRNGPLLGLRAASANGSPPSELLARVSPRTAMNAPAFFLLLVPAARGSAVSEWR